MNTYLGYYNFYISNYFLKRPQFDAMQKITYFYFPRFIKAVPIMGPGFLQSFLEFLLIEFCFFNNFGKLKLIERFSNI